MSITVIGAGKTGRGFIGRLLAESSMQINFIDKNVALVAELNAKKQFRISFFGGKREDFAVANYTTSTWEDVKTVEDELILVSVCGPNLPDVGAALKTRLDPEKHYYIITAENSSKPAKVLKEANQSPERALFISGYYTSGRRANYAVDLADGE